MLSPRVTFYFILHSDYRQRLKGFRPAEKRLQCTLLGFVYAKNRPKLQPPPILIGVIVI